MILEKFEEKQKVECMRNLLNGIIFGFLMVIIFKLAKGYGIDDNIINDGCIVILIISNIYFKRVLEAQKKYERFMIYHKKFIDKDGIENAKNVLVLLKYRNIRNIGISILEDSNISQDGYYTTISASFILASLTVVYNLYKLRSEPVSPYIYIISVTIISFLIVFMVDYIYRIGAIKERTKEFIINKGWDKKWKK